MLYKLQWSFGPRIYNVPHYITLFHALNWTAHRQAKIITSAMTHYWPLTAVDFYITVLQMERTIKKRRCAFMSIWKSELGSTRVAADCANHYTMPHPFWIPLIISIKIRGFVASDDFVSKTINRKKRIWVNCY